MYYIVYTKYIAKLVVYNSMNRQVQGSRFERGQVLAVSAQISKVREIPSSVAGPLTVWSVESERIQNKYYSVVEKDTGFICNCPDYVIRGEVCKHAYSVIIRETT